ncbi:Bug family tripartite tricarboxylate transporter substrate binding protein [Cupriavidus consociatus]|uniref:Bug family tripartite tricarboxylate transporter substrate binding protein n=1 Tax=Cupriavidus consociatus TaxID=2821357 RepID=UPI001AE979A0|nr:MULTISPECIES: tripartite tricarboxylate transporter substrate binding protein [unclassified Cupriavidus]MBP0622364.1 tripartite tricarboxylate transporter substrate binding protein [Cupriavidus sp. LEh25]MDK2659049.1 tripartite tricarboxylate transporter substrate binding protein [Cupriavidus sp. LEh21]
MKRITTAVVAALSLFSTPVFASAADYPNKPIRVLVPYPPGGSTDGVARLVGQRLSAKLGQPVVIDNRPGASEAIAAAAVAKSAPDGYTLLFATMTGLSVNPSLYSKLSYDPAKDFTPIIQVTSIPSVVVVNPNVPVRTMSELARYLKSRPSSEGYASAGNGTPSHLGMELYKKATNTNVVHVPYKGGAPALQDLMAGQVQIMMALAPEAMPLVKGGKLKALAITTSKRATAYPELPTVSENGLPGFEMIFWQALVAPTGTPKDVTAKLNKAINEILAEPEIKRRLVEMDLESAGGTPEALEVLMNTQAGKWKKVILDAGIKLD